MEQNEIIEEVKSKNLEVEKTVEEPSVEELETGKVDQTSENSAKGNSVEVEPDKSGDPVTEMGSSEKADEIYQKLKAELMEEIRKYFDPLLKERKPVTEVLNQDETLPLEREDNLINRIIDETGW